MQKYLLGYAIAILLILVGCASETQQGAVEVEQLPTRIPTTTPEFNNLDNAERVAREFLAAWQTTDFAAMYTLLSAASQQSIPFDQFVTTYQSTYDEMTANRVMVQENGLARDNNDTRVSILNYDATFSTNILGDFTDAGRSLYLVLDPVLQDWRVAWSRGDIFREMENGGQLRLEPSVSRRASIYDINGQLLASQDGTVVTVSVVPQEISNIDICLNTLDEAMTLDRQTIADRIGRFGADWLGEVGFMEVAAYEAWADLIEQNCNAQFGSRSARSYSDGDLAPHILGNVGYLSEGEISGAAAQGFNQDSILGRSGIEASWDEVLRGTPGGRLSVVTPDGRTLRVLAESTSSPALSVYLTLDAGLQRAAQEAIINSYETFDNFGGGSRGASAVIMDVNTGAILAMVSYPSYDANVFVPFPEIGTDAAAQIITALENDERRPLLNRATQGTYPTGSIFKTITSIAIMDAGIYQPDTRYVCNGTWEGVITRFDWLPSGHGTLDVAGAITNSCNPYFYEAGLQLHLQDPNLLYQYATRLGLGGTTGMTDLVETPGYIGNEALIQQITGYPMTSVDSVSMAIGQGHVNLSPLQMVRYYAAVANGGTLYRPQIVESTRLIDDVSYQMEPEITGTFGVSEEIMATVHRGMCDVTTTATGTAEFVFRNSEIQTLGVCGKTGTASDESPEPGLPHAWFAAYAPADNPQIAIITMVENSGQGSEVAAPIALEILEYYFFGPEEAR